MLRYRAEIDGLRAIAVMPVILFHAGFELFRGGFVGVDVFFVISGYLITTIMIEDLDKKKFSILNFYERRARRILPVLFVVMFVSVVFAWVLLPDLPLDNFGNGLLGVSLFVSNVVFWMQQGYFEESAELNPILHTWSLAVEEQFYIFFPIFLILTWRFGKSRVFWMVFLMSAVSLLLSEWGWRNHASACFYLAPTRVWELFAGSIAALIINKKGVRKNNPLALLGLIAIISSMLFFYEGTPVPSIYTLIPVLGTVLLVLYAEKETIIAKLLSNKLFVGLGLISYSAYLWHQSIFSFFRVYKNQVSLSWLHSTALILIILLLSYFSWKMVETPFRNRSFMRSSSVFLLSLLGLLSLFGIGYASKKVSHKSAHEMARMLSENHFLYWNNIDERKFMEGRLIYPLRPVDTVIVGSSRVMQINSRIMGHDVQNLAVSGASIEDDISLGLEALAKLNYQNIYISADPWLINLHDNAKRYKSIEQMFDFWIKRMYANQPLSQFLDIELNQTIKENPETLLKSLRAFLLLNNRKIPVDESVEAYAKKAYDGFNIYNNTYANKTSELIASGFNSTLDYCMKDFEYDTQSIKHLEAFVAYLQWNGVSVNFILSPYHPEVYRKMVEEKPIFLEIEDWFIAFAKKNNVRVIGSYDPISLGFTNNDFYDGMHPKTSCMQKLFLNFNE